MRRSFKDIPDRYIARFLQRIKFIDSGCWLWCGCLCYNGYGQFTVAWSHKENTKFMAHRLSYEIMVGPIPDGLQIDHLCRNRACVNPDHMEPVTMRDNCLRGTGCSALNAVKTHCPKSHSLSGDNIRSYHKGRKERECRTCDKERKRARYAQSRANKSSVLCK